MTAVMSSGDFPSRRHEVLRVLRASSDPMSVVAIADLLVVHRNTVRFHLRSLVGDDLVEVVEPGRIGRGRPGFMFRAVRQMDRGGKRDYQLLAEILTRSLASGPRPRVKALAAGQAWGHSLAELESPEGEISADEAVEGLVGILDGLGFAPERREPETDGELQVGLRHCPFLELAESETKVVCPLHLGIVQGILDTWGAPVSADRLDEFAGPDLCLLHLKLVSTND